MLLCCSLILAWSPIEFSVGERAESPATIYFWLPAGLKGSGLFFSLVRFGLTVSTLLWMFRKAVPWSGWATVILFTLMWSLRMENLTNGAHIFNIANWLLLIHAAWFHFYRDELRDATRRGDMSTALVYPRWVFMLCLTSFHRGTTKVTAQKTSFRRIIFNYVWLLERPQQRTLNNGPKFHSKSSLS